MPLIVTLVCNPNEAHLSAALVAQVADALNSRIIEPLSAHIACDIEPDMALGRADCLRLAREALGGEPVDIIVQTRATRRKKILIADMDSTMIDQECIDELAAEIGLKEHVAAITQRAMNGEIEFEPALRERVALLKGLDESVVQQVIDQRITLASGGRELIATLRANGTWTALVSGGFRSFTGPIAQALGFDEDHGNILNIEDGKFTGTVSDPIIGREAKAQAVIDISTRLGLSADHVMAVGDGANDLGMIQMAGSGVALHAKPSVAAEAPIRIDHGDLTALLYMQGYRQSDFIL